MSVEFPAIIIVVAIISLPQKVKLFYLYMTHLKCIDFHIIGYWTSNMFILTYFFGGNPLLPYRLLFPINNKGTIICTFPQTGQHIPQALMDQLWTDHWLERKISQTANGCNKLLESCRTRCVVISHRSEFILC